MDITTSATPKNFIARLRGDSSRKSEASKEMQVYATDVDYAVIVVSINNPKFSSLILDKYLLLCEYGNVTPLIVVNKMDLAKDLTCDLEYYKNVLGIKVVLASTVTGIGISELYKLLTNKTCVFLGKSGVGKSSLINTLRGTNDLKIGDVSKKYGEGQHTTTSTEKYLIGDATWVIDTPGLRNIDVSNISPEVLQDLYPDFLKYRGECKYSDCVHYKENNCAIKKAVEDGDISQERYENYLKIANV